MLMTLWTSYRKDKKRDIIIDGLVGAMATAFGEGAEPKSVQGSRRRRRWKARVGNLRMATHGTVWVPCALVWWVKWKPCPTDMCLPSPSSHWFTHQWAVHEQKKLQKHLYFLSLHRAFHSRPLEWNPDCAEVSVHFSVGFCRSRFSPAMLISKI